MTDPLGWCLIWSIPDSVTVPHAELARWWKELHLPADAAPPRPKEIGAWRNTLRGLRCTTYQLNGATARLVLAPARASRLSVSRDLLRELPSGGRARVARSIFYRPETRPDGRRVPSHWRIEVFDPVQIYNDTGRALYSQPMTDQERVALELVAADLRERHSEVRTAPNTTILRHAVHHVAEQAHGIRFSHLMPVYFFLQPADNLAELIRRVSGRATLVPVQDLPEIRGQLIDAAENHIRGAAKEIIVKTQTPTPRLVLQRNRYASLLGLAESYQKAFGKLDVTEPLREVLTALQVAEARRSPRARSIRPSR